MTHANAPLTPVGRLRLAKLIVEDGWSPAQAAEFEAPEDVIERFRKSIGHLFEQHL